MQTGTVVNVSKKKNSDFSNTEADRHQNVNKSRIISTKLKKVRNLILAAVDLVLAHHLRAFVKFNGSIAVP
jgi:hypothetical protein